jgi:hypothetical protein
MKLGLGFETSLPREQMAALTVTLRTEKGGSPFEIPVLAAGVVDLEIPEELSFQDAPLFVGLRAIFRNIPQTVAEAAVRLPLGGFLRGIRITQSKQDYVEALLDHHEQFRGTLIDQCTVFCPGTGESRSGRNVCIECKGSRGIVRICC